VTLEHHSAFFSPLYPSPLGFLSSLFRRSDPPSMPSGSVPRSLLCFDTLTNPFSRSSFLLTFLQTAGGCHPATEQISKPKLELEAANSSSINKSSRCRHRPARNSRNRRRFRCRRASSACMMAAPMECHCINATQIPHTTRLYSSYLNDFPSVAEFFAHPPTLDSVSKVASELAVDLPLRLKVADILRAQNRAFGADAAVETSLDQFAAGASTVVSGQQVGLFSGPSYTIYKVLTPAAGRGTAPCGPARDHGVLAGDGRSRPGRGEPLLVAH